jgi:beta-glucosidase
MVAIKRAALLAGLAQLIGIGAAQDAITDDSHFYGQSPPVYPSRRFASDMACGGEIVSFDTILMLSFAQSAEMVGGNEWEAAFQKAKLLVGKMTLEEKVRPRDGKVHQAL